MSDDESLAAEADLERAESRTRRISRRREAKALAGPPGNPPVLYCEECRQRGENCECIAEPATEA